MRLVDGTHLVGGGAWGPYLSNAFDANVYLVQSGDEAALVDAGIGLATDAICENIISAGLSLSQIRWILLTHCHADHSGGVAALKRLTGARVVASKACAEAVERGTDALILGSALRHQYCELSDWDFEPCKVDVLIEGEDAVPLGRGAVTVIPSPGHSEDHLAYAFGGSFDVPTMLFSGDCVFFGGTILLQNVPGCRIDAYAETICRLAHRPVELLLPGHMFFALRDGASHIRAAARAFADRRVPPNVDIPHAALAM